MERYDTLKNEWIIYDGEIRRNCTTQKGIKKAFDSILDDMRGLMPDFCCEVSINKP